MFILIEDISKHNIYWYSDSKDDSCVFFCYIRYVVTVDVVV